MARTPRFEIRRAVAADAEAIARTHVACWRETYAGLMPERVLAALDVEARRVMWKRTIRHRRHDTFVCVEQSDGAVVGFAGSGPRRAVPKDFDGEFLAIYLLQAAQGFGMGRELMRTMAEAMRERGCRSGALRVARDSPGARGFYEHLGGVDAGEGSHKVDDFRIVTTVYGWPDLTVLM